MTYNAFTLIETNALKNSTLAIIGLGYVGLPLAVAFAKKYNVIGYDIDIARVKSLRAFKDSTGEISAYELKKKKRLSFTFTPSELSKANIFIITVPTPIDENNIPDLSPLISATKLIAKYIKKMRSSFTKSTVYPGATEDICVPILQKLSGMKFNCDFYVGYSPERVNPGDKDRKVIDIKKITSASTPETLNIVDKLYKSIIKGGTYRASSIKIAEAAKVVENSQRDLNIAFMNELSKIFHMAKINTAEVIEAASSKWNFIKYSPGLVGGHCISVDPYYLTNKAEAMGYYPDLILTARRVNESMASFIASVFAKMYLTRKKIKTNRNILIFGVTFKENCPDIRNSKIFDLIKFFKDNGFNPDIVDPVVLPCDVLKQEGIKVFRKPRKSKYAGVILAVAHRQYINEPIEYFRNFLIQDGIFFDLKSIYKKEFSDFQL